MFRLAVPYVTCIEFGDRHEKWSNAFFNILAKDSKQKKLKILCLPRINKVIKAALKNMVEKGVKISFYSVGMEVLKDLPAHRFESFNTTDNKLRFLKDFNCTFRRLQFFGIDLNYLKNLPKEIVLASVEEVLINFSHEENCSEQLFTVIKRIFPKVEKVTVKELHITDRGENHKIEQQIEELKDAVRNAPQKVVRVTMMIYCCKDPPHWIKIFDGEKIGEYHYQWKSKSDENKIVGLEIWV
uniref:DUF38 domain-containing protein n=1 Tax=Panagrolaimus sp. JU765 TaxID=591449 RepID=A0AC34QFY8_9BILA